MLRIPLNAIAQRLRQKRRAGPLQSGFDEDIVFDVDHINELDGSVHGARVIREDEGAVNNTDRIKVVERFDSFEEANSSRARAKSLSGGKPATGPRRGAVISTENHTPEARLELAIRRRASGVRNFHEWVSVNYQVALCWLQSTRLHQWAVALSSHIYFESLVFFAIVANSILLGTYSYNKSPSSPVNRASLDSDVYFLAIFIFEMAVKVFARGYLYFCDAWNILDAIVVVTGIIDLLPSTGDSNLSALRAARVLRPLRMAHILPGLKRLVSTVLASVTQLGNIAVVFVYVLVVFGLLGLSLFQGSLGRRCALPGPDGAALVDPETGDYVLAAPDSDQTCTRTEGFFSGQLCPDGQVCVYAGVYPNQGVTRFDNFLWASLLNFQITTLEGWTTAMYLTMDATSGFAFLYFVILVFVGAMFLVNLVLAVITNVYDTTAEAKSMENANATKRAIARIPGAKCVKKVASWIGAIWGRTSLELPDSGPLGWVKHRCQQLVDVDHDVGKYFSWFITGLILVNLVSLSLVWDGQSKEMEDALEVVNVVMVVSFLTEMVVRFLALGIKRYFRDAFNTLDFFINFISIMELAIGGSGSLSALRAMRAFRALKLLQSFQTLQLFLDAMARCVIQLGNFFLMVLLTMVVFALLGMSFLGGKLGPPSLEEKPRMTMDTLPWAMLYVFQIMTGEDWNSLMYDAISAVGTPISIFFVIVIILGNFIVVNLFIAILLSSFAEIHAERQEAAREKRRARRQSTGGKKRKSFKEDPVGVAARLLMLQEAGNEGGGRGGEEANRSGDGTSDSTRAGDDTGAQEGKRAGDGGEGRAAAGGREGERAGRDVADGTADARGGSQVWRGEENASIATRGSHGGTEEDGEERGARELMAARSGIEEIKARMREIGKRAQPRGSGGTKAKGKSSAAGDGWGCPKPLELYGNRSFFVLGSSNAFRRACFKLVDRKGFDLVILVLIILSSITMALETPGNMADEAFSDALFYVDICFTSLFATEMFLKITAMGLTGDDGAYLADGWNWVDGTIVAFSAANVLIGLLSSSSDLGALRALRVARVLRPLRVIKRVPELRLVVTALLRSLPGISSVMVVSFFFWFIFGVIGVNLFRGAFYSCNDTSDAIVTKQDCQGAFVDDDGTVVERRWTNADQNFDNIGNALLTLFEISTTEGWIDVMFQGIDAAGKDLQPQRNAHPENAFYFVAFMLVASFLLVNMFVGIVLDSFGCVREEQQSITLLTPEQRDWMIAQIHIVGPLSIAPKHVRPKSHWRARIFDVVVHPRFDIFIAAAISVNTLFMLTQHYNQPNTWSNVLDTVDLCFTILYTAEMIAKIIALGFRGYIDSRWNQLDGTVVILGMLELAFNDIFQGSESTALRAVRVARVVRVLKTWKGLQAMFLTLFASLPTMANVGGVLLLTFWIYAVLGLNLFGKVTQNGEELNDNANFSNVGLSMLTLLRMATGEAWNTIMHEAMRSEPPYCCPSGSDTCPEGTTEGDCGSSVAAVIYFVSFTIICAFIVLNLFLAIVLDNYSALMSGTALTSADVADFQALWMDLDTEGTGFIPARMLLPVLEVLPPPLGKATVDAKSGRCLRAPRAAVTEILQSLEAEAFEIGGFVGPMVFYKDVLVALTCLHFSVSTSALPASVLSSVTDKCRALRQSQAHDALRIKQRRLRVLRKDMRQSETGQRSRDDGAGMRRGRAERGGEEGKMDSGDRKASIDTAGSAPRSVLDRLWSRVSDRSKRPGSPYPMSPDSRPGTPSSRRTQLRPYNGDPRGPADSLAPSLNPRATLTGLQLARVASGMLHPEDRVSRPPQVDRRQLRRAFLSGELQHSGKTGGEGSRRGSGRRGAGRDEGQADGESGDSPDGLRGILPDRLQRLSDHISAWYAVDVQTEVLGTRVAGELRDRALAVELDTWSGRDGPRRAALLRGLSHAVLWQAEEIIVVAAERSGVPLGPDGLPVRGVDGTALLEVADMWDREIGDLLAGTLSIDKGGLMREEEGDRVPDLTLSRQKADSGGCIVM